MNKVFFALAIVFFLAGVASADPLALPSGAYVSAVCNGDGTATVRIEGVRVEKFHKYFYFKKQEVLEGVQEVVFSLNETRRFQFTHSGGFFAGLSREMGKKYWGAEFLGPNVDLDDKDSPAFVITCPVVKKAKK